MGYARQIPTIRSSFLIRAVGLVSYAVILAAALLWVDGSQASDPSSVVKTQIQQTYGKLPLSFEANQGQTERQVRFLSRGPGYTLFLTPREAVVALRGRETVTRSSSTSPRPTEGEGQGEGAILRMQFGGTKSEAKMTGLEKLPGIVNYFVSKDPHQWQTNTPTFAKVKQPQVYPGIDLVYYGNQRQLEFDFIVAPGADPNAIRLSFQGAKDLKLDEQGDLIMHLSDGEVRLPVPNVYQEFEGKKQRPGSVRGQVLTLASDRRAALAGQAFRGTDSIRVVL
jgi:hypothetical protein